MFTLSFETENASFHDEALEPADNAGYRSDEISRILRKVATDVDLGESEGSIVDSNGNTVGRWVLDI